MSISISPEVAALLGALIGALPSLVAKYMEIRVRAREQMRELAVRSAIESWKFTAEHSRVVAPIEHSIFHAAKMAEIAFSDEKLTPKELADRLEAISKLMDALSEHSQAIRAKAQGR